MRTVGIQIYTLERWKLQQLHNSQSFPTNTTIIYISVQHKGQVYYFYYFNRREYESKSFSEKNSNQSITILRKCNWYIFKTKKNIYMIINTRHIHAKYSYTRNLNTNCTVTLSCFVTNEAFSYEKSNQNIIIAGQDI